MEIFFFAPAQERAFISIEKKYITVYGHILSYICLTK